MTLFAKSAAIEIVPRDLTFGRDQTLARWWQGGDPVATAFYNALSITFPKGEAFFIRSVRFFANEAPPALRSEIQAFCRQEAFHTREHAEFNRQVEAAGFVLSDFEPKLVRAMEQPALMQLLITVSLEHFTAIIAHALLSDPRHLADASPASRAMWRWHAMEEIEHKAVAYDTFLWVTRDMPASARWKLRCRVMVGVSLRFFLGRRRTALALLAQDGLDTPANRRRLDRFLWLSPGLYRQIALGWLGYFVPGFHPWRRDDRKLLVPAA
jgi:predicted metal-dependent hydrolase